MAELANLYDKRIAHETWEAVRRAAAEAPAQITPETASAVPVAAVPPGRNWLPATASPARSGGPREIDTGVSSGTRLAPIQPVPQVHGRRTLHPFGATGHGVAQDDGPLGRVYRSIREKQILHLALLLHDLGKGYPEDHSEIGRQTGRGNSRPSASCLARNRDSRIPGPQTPSDDTTSRVWRDINDPEVVLNLTVEVGSREVLRMLYILSAADLASVGPSVLNDWKVELLTQLFEQTMERLSSDDPVTSDRKALDQRRRAVADCLVDEPDQAWYAEHIEALPPAFLRGHSPGKHCLCPGSTARDAGG